MPKETGGFGFGDIKVPRELDPDKLNKQISAQEERLARRHELKKIELGKIMSRQSDPIATALDIEDEQEADKEAA